MSELPLSKYQITKPIFDIFTEVPHALGWLAKCRHDLPDGPGMVYLGIGNEIQLIKLAEESIRSMVNGFLDDPSYWKRFDNVSEHVTTGLNRDLDRLWIAWTNYVWTDEDQSS